MARKRVDFLRLSEMGLIGACGEVGPHVLERWRLVQKHNDKNDDNGVQESGVNVPYFLLKFGRICGSTWRQGAPEFRGGGKSYLALPACLEMLKNHDKVRSL